MESNANQPVNPTEIPTQPVQHPTNNQRGNIPIILGVLVLLLGVGGSAYYLGTQNSKNNIMEPVTNQQIPNLTPSTTPQGQQPSPVLVDDSKTYRNTKNNFSIAIPSDWIPNKRTPDGNITDEQFQQADGPTWEKDSSIFSIQVLEACTVLTTCFENYQSTANEQGGPYTSNKTTTTKSTRFGKSTIVARSSYGGSENIVRGLFFIQSGKLWLVEYQSLPLQSENIEKEVDQFLTALQFTN